MFLLFCFPPLSREWRIVLILVSRREERFLRWVWKLGEGVSILQRFRVEEEEEERGGGGEWVSRNASLSSGLLWSTLGDGCFAEIKGENPWHVAQWFPEDKEAFCKRCIRDSHQGYIRIRKDRELRAERKEESVKILFYHSITRIFLIFRIDHRFKRKKKEKKKRKFTILQELDSSRLGLINFTGKRAIHKARSLRRYKAIASES